MINAAVMGMGWWGKYIIEQLHNGDRIRVTRSVNTDPDKIREFTDQHGIDATADLADVLADPDIDAVIVVTPHALHEEHVIAAANAGKHVFCEKPLALTAAGAEKMLSACDANDVVLGVGHERRYEPGIIETLRRANAGEIGDVMHVEINCSNDIMSAAPGPSWRQEKKHSPAGALTAIGVHLTDVLQALAGDVETVIARTARRTETQPLDDVLSVQFGFKSGVTGYMSTLASTPFYFRMTVFGSAGWIELSEVSNIFIDDPATLTWRGKEGDVQTESHPHLDTVQMNLHGWADAIEGKGDYPISRHQKLHNVEILEAIVASAETETTVSI